MLQARGFCCALASECFFLSLGILLCKSFCLCDVENGLRNLFNDAVLYNR